LINIGRIAGRRKRIVKHGQEYGISFRGRGKEGREGKKEGREEGRGRY